MAWKNLKAPRGSSVTMEGETRDTNRSPGCGCEELRKVHPRAVISPTVVGKAMGLCAKLPNLEWIAALTGRISEDKLTIYVDDLHIFEQETQGAHCVFSDGAGVMGVASLENMIGIMHSHNNMGVFFSGTDEDNAVGHRISIVTNNKAEFFGKARVDYPCGGWDMHPLKFAFVSQTIEPAAETLALIKEKKYQYLGYQGGSVCSCVTCTANPTNAPHGAVGDWRARYSGAKFCDICMQSLPKKQRKWRFCTTCKKVMHAECELKHDEAAKAKGMKGCPDLFEEKEWDEDDSPSEKHFMRDLVNEMAGMGGCDV